MLVSCALAYPLLKTGPLSLKNADFHPFVRVDIHYAYLLSTSAFREKRAARGTNNTVHFKGTFVQLYAH